MRLGLRERYVAVLALVSAVTLAVAAIALFSPLDRRLRAAATEALAQSVRTELHDFTDLPASAVRRGAPELRAAARGLRRTGAEVELLDASGHVLFATDLDRGNSLAAARAALRTGREAHAVAGDGGTADEVQVALPLDIHGVRAVVSARRALDDLHDVTGVVRRAFVVGAVGGLLAALLVGLLIANRTAGRIRRLRDSAERVAEVGPVGHFRAEAGRDEIGDLSRTFEVMQARLREQEEARRAFVATASHELRTPVTSLQVLLELLIADLEAEPAAVADALAQARTADEQAARLSQLAAQLLDLSRIDAGVALRHERVDMGEILRSVVAELRVYLGEHRRALVVAADGASPWGMGDPGSVARIVRILLDNALRHTPARGEVRAALATDGARTGIAVQDEGPGVAVEARARIFERFARGAEAEPGGFGLGLAIGRELARRMGGDLVLEDTAAGARFVLWLPAATSPSAAGPTSSRGSRR